MKSYWSWLIMENFHAEAVESICKETLKLAKKLQKTKRESNRKKISAEIEGNIRFLHRFVCE